MVSKHVEVRDTDSLRTYKEVLLWASSFLEEQKQERYAAEWLLKEMQGWTKTELIQHLHLPMPHATKDQYLCYIEKAARGVPPQQLIGHAWFYGRRFEVTSDTLIPRPETEELVEAVLDSLPQTGPVRIVDIGTGTGAIACTLKAERPEAHVTGIDLSPKALAVAKKNGLFLETPIRWLEGDLTDPVAQELFDVVVSNPPYIGRDEESTLQESVRTYEPEMALFAEKDGFAIYERLSQELPLISHAGTLFFLEIGFAQGPRVKEMMQHAFPTREIEILRDLSGKDRMIRISEEKNNPAQKEKNN